MQEKLEKKVSRQNVAKWVTNLLAKVERCCTKLLLSRLELLCLVTTNGMRQHYQDRGDETLKFRVENCLWRPKGQSISKCLFGIFNSLKKQTIRFNFTTMVPQVELFCSFFWENWRHQKDISKLTDLYIMSNWRWRFCQALWSS